MTDPFDLQRFIDAQDEQFGRVLEELRAGSKQSHWMWFIFPQFAGLGRSPVAQFYAISSLDEARAYLGHPLLGPRLRQCLKTLLPWAGQRTPAQMLGPIDATKLRSCLTLFEAASDEPDFGQALDVFFGGRRDDATIRLLTEA